MSQKRTETTTACFGVVTKKIRNIFRHFPKSKSWSEGLQLLQTPKRALMMRKDYTFSHLLECQSLIQLEQSDGTGSIKETPSCVKTIKLHNQQRQSYAPKQLE